MSGGIYASLNFGNPSDIDLRDPPGNIRVNFERVQRGLGCVERERLSIRQVHGRAVYLQTTGATVPDNACGDAIVTTDPGALAVVRTADCVPVLIASADGHQVAAVHAGWRGVAQNIVQATLAHFAHPASTRVAIGPCIGRDAFEVGMDVVTEMASLASTLGVPVTQFTRLVPARDKAFVDLRAAIVLQLLQEGVARESIDCSNQCTMTDPEFFSHRRDQGRTGRMAAMIGVR